MTTIRHDIPWIVAGGVGTAVTVAFCIYFTGHRRGSLLEVTPMVVMGAAVGGLTALRYGGRRALVVGAIVPAALALVLQWEAGSDEGSVSHVVAFFLAVWTSPSLFALVFPSRIPFEWLLLRSLIAWVVFCIGAVVVIMFRGFYNAPKVDDVLGQTLDLVFPVTAALAVLHVRGGRPPRREQGRGFPIETTRRVIDEDAQ